MPKRKPLPRRPADSKELREALIDDDKCPECRGPLDLLTRICHKCRFDAADESMLIPDFDREIAAEWEKLTWPM